MEALRTRLEAHAESLGRELLRKQKESNTNTCRLEVNLRHIL